MPQRNVKQEMRAVAELLEWFLTRRCTVALGLVDLLCVDISGCLILSRDSPCFLQSHAESETCRGSSPPQV